MGPGVTRGLSTIKLQKLPSAGRKHLDISYDDGPLTEAPSKRKKKEVEDDKDYEDNDAMSDDGDDDYKPDERKPSNSTKGTKRSAESSKRAQLKKRIRSSVKEGRPPDEWERVWDGIARMREKNDAPVDTMGCEALALDEPDAKVPLFFAQLSTIIHFLSSILSILSGLSSLNTTTQHNTTNTHIAI